MKTNTNIRSGYGLDDVQMSRKYAFTLWMDDHLDEKTGHVIPALSFAAVRDTLQRLFEDEEFRYACVSQEVCPETGRLHGHLFFRSNASKSGVSWMKKFGFLPGQAWCEEIHKDVMMFEYVACVGHFAAGQRKGKPKPLQFFEIGERPLPKARTKKREYAVCFARLQAGEPLLEVAREFPEFAIKHFLSLERMEKLFISKKKASAAHV